MGMDVEKSNGYGYYSGNDNILQTLIDCLYDTTVLLVKSSINVYKWIKEKNQDNKEDENEKFIILWNELKIKNNIGNTPILFKSYESEDNYTYMFTIPVGLSINTFTKYEHEIAQFLHCKIKNLKIELINNLLSITVFKNSKTEVCYENFDFKNDSKEIAIPMGKDLNGGSIIYWNPNSENQCHLLIAGNTGSGKSTYEYVILSHLIKNYKNIKLYLQDVKMVDMWSFRNAKQVECYNRGTEYAEETSCALVQEMENRYKYLNKYDCRTMNELDDKRKLNTIFFIIEELATFNPKKDKEFFENLGLLLAKGRAVSIVVICITQTPYCTVLPGELKSNFPVILGLKTRTGEASKVICGDFERLTRLRGKGHGVFFTPDGDFEIQGFNIDKDTIDDIVKHNK